jgi:pimeloyl-ACP methyl ester carboxylesterase
MEKKTIVHLHGLVSSEQSTKARYFKEKLKAFPQVEFHVIDFNPTPKDFEYVTTTGRINRLRQYVLDHHLGNVFIIGSSYGGLIALHYAHRFGGVEKMLLLAPGLTWLSGGLSEEQLEQWKKAGAAPVFHDAFGKEVPIRYGLQVDGLRYLEPIPPAAPMIIIHGRSDETVPIEPARAYAADFPDSVRLIEVDAGHNLNGHLELIWGYVQSFLLVPFHATKPLQPGLKPL